MIRLRVGSFNRLFHNGQQYDAGDEFEVPEAAALNFLRSGLVLPADGDWRGVVPGAPPAPVRPSQRRKPAPVCPCPPPARKPGKALSVCAVPGCSCQVLSGKCRAHARTSTTTLREYGTGHRNVSADLRKRWEHERREYLRAHPYCECPECLAIAEPLRPAASEVDHIDGLGLLGPRAFDWGNLQSLTKRHHSRKTARESFGH